MIRFNHIDSLFRVSLIRSWMNQSFKWFLLLTQNDLQWSLCHFQCRPPQAVVFSFLWLVEVMNYLGYEQCSTGEWESKFQSLNVWVSLRCHVFVSQVSDASVSDLCVEALCWARRLLPFCRFLNAEEALQDLVLSLLSELPPSHVVIHISVSHTQYPHWTPQISTIPCHQLSRLTHKSAILATFRPF